MHGNERGDEEGVDMRKSSEKKEVEEPEAIAHLHTSLGKKTYVVQIYHIRKEGGGGGVPKWQNPIFRPHVADFHPTTPLITLLNFYISIHLKNHISKCTSILIYKISVYKMS